MDASRIRQEVTARRGRSQTRLNLYERAYREFFSYHHSADGAVRPMQGDGRPIDRLENFRGWLNQRTGAPNYVPIIVEDFKSLRGPVPAMKVKPRSESDAERQLAENWTRVLREQWDHSNMDLQQEESAFYWSLLGEDLYLLEPIFPAEAEERDIAPGVYISVYPPEVVFPKMRVGWDRFELDSVAITATMSAEEAEELFPAFRGEGDRQVEVIYWWDDDVKQVVIDGVEVDRWDHGLGEVPAVWSRTKQHGGASNQSDVVNILDLNREMQTAFMVMSDGLILGTFAEKVIIEPLALPEQIATGPGAIIPVRAGGDAKLLQPSAFPSYGQTLVDAGVKHMEHVSGASSVRVESGITGSNISGRAIRNSQGAQEQRLAISQANMGRTFQMINRKILRMLFKLKEFHTDIPVWGEEKGSVYSFSFNPRELEGWSKTTVEWDAAIGSTSHERIVQGLQMHAARAVPRWYIGQQAGLDDPEQMVRMADDDALAQAKTDAKAQQAMQPQQPPGPPGGQPDPGADQQHAEQPMQQGLSMEGGGMPPGQQPPGGAPAGPPQMPGFPDMPPAGGPRGSPAPVADFDAEVEKLLKPIAAQLQGHIISVMPTREGVKVTLTNSKDFPLIRRALSPLGKVSVSVQGVTTGKNGAHR